MPVDRNNLFLTVLGNEIGNICSPITSKGTGREIGTIERGTFVPKRIKEEPVVPFDQNKKEL